jgi:hypothetical protein
MSPISSRKRVPPSASSNLPLRSLMALVKLPFMCPNSSLSISSPGMAAQFTSMKGPWARALLVDQARHAFLARAVAAGDQHAGIAGGHLFDHLTDRSPRPCSRPPSAPVAALALPTFWRSTLVSCTRLPRSSALRTLTRIRLMSGGFWMKSKAPFFRRPRRCRWCRGR